MVGPRRDPARTLRRHGVPARQHVVRRGGLPPGPVARIRDPAGAHLGRIPAGHDAVRRPAHRRAHAVRVAGPGQRRPNLRRCPALLRRTLPASDRQHPAWLAPADPRDHPGHPRGVPVRLAARRHPRRPTHGAGGQPGRADRDHPHDDRCGRCRGTAQSSRRRDRHVRDRLRRGRGVRVPRRPRLGPDPGARRDPDDGHVRAGPSHDAGRGPVVRRIPSTPCLARYRCGPARRRRRRLRDQRPPAPGGLQRLRRHRLPDRGRLQRRQRHARGHPRLGHPRRDHGAARRRHRRRQPGLPEPSLRLRPAHRRRGEDPLRPARHRGRPHRHRGARGLPRPVAGRRDRPRPTGPLARPRGHHPAHLPHDDGAEPVLLLHRPQQPRRRLRRRTRGGPGTGAALPRRWAVRTRRGHPVRRGPDPRRGTAPGRRHGNRLHGLRGSRAVQRHLRVDTPDLR